MLYYNLGTQRLDSTVHFAGPGDYEHVARVPGGWLILRSDGTVFWPTGRTTTPSRPALVPPASPGA